jgi:V8-like Glu-specific endopeptidase
MLRVVNVWIAVMFLVMSFSLDMARASFFEGQVREVQVRTPQFSGQKSFAKPSVLWSHIVRQPGTAFLRVHFKDIQDTIGQEYTISIKDYRDRVVAQYERSDFIKSSDFWTDIIYGSVATIQVIGKATPDGLSFTIAEYAYQARGHRPLSTIGNSENEPIRNYKSDDGIYSSAKGIAKLSIIRDGSLTTCTGFMIGRDLLITNQHCVPEPSLCRDILAIFGYEEMAGETVTRGEQYHCSEAMPPNYVLDFVLLRMTGEPGKKWGVLTLSDRSLVSGEALMVIHHPNGEPKQISKRDCTAVTVPADGRGKETDFGHSCDTLGGSSGSPMLDMNRQVVGIHHIPTSSGRWGKENRAVQTKLVRCAIPDGFVNQAGCP